MPGDVSQHLLEIPPRQLALDAARIPHLNEEDAFGGTIRWGSGHSMDLKFDSIHE